ncbi:MULTISPECIES: DODA-type extradiol aromatic ring-opening family dioxygenase [unclassified Marinovum]|uniref:DODA-type extradiol aromatic ring-opening family dioxygenase n=1 Tax=unclassified Marinovum TaxID=2647166 RepID=UPI003EDC998D
MGGTGVYRADQPRAAAAVRLSGVSPHTYQLTWPAPGDPTLAARASELLNGAGFETRADATRGFDHGVFVPLKVALPEADIPTVQLSLRDDLDAEAHLAAGRALAPLRDEGVLIIGSGNTYHNMSKMMRAMRGGPDGPVNGGDFDRWLTGAVTHEDPGARRAMLAAWDRAPGARDANPREEHLIPLHVVAGAALADRGKRPSRITYWARSKARSDLDRTRYVLRTSLAAGSAPRNHRVRPA